MDKALIKEELDSPSENQNMNLLNMSSHINSKDENNPYKDNLFMPQNLNMKDPISFGMKDPYMNHLQPKHSLNLKEPPIDMHKEQIVNMNHSNYISNTSEIKQESPYGYQNPPPSQQPEKSTAGKILFGT